MTQGQGFESPHYLEINRLRRSLEGAQGNTTQTSLDSTIDQVYLLSHQMIIVYQLTVGLFFCRQSLPRYFQIPILLVDLLLPFCSG